MNNFESCFQAENYSTCKDNYYLYKILQNRIDGQFLTFKGTTSIYSIKEFFKLENDNSK